MNKKFYFHSFVDISSAGYKGYLKLILSPKNFSSKLQTFSIGQLNYYIISGVFILNKAHSLFANNNLEIDGFMLDTTWRATPNYVLLILNCCFLNSSLPIAFSFGGGETISLYDFLLSTVKKQLNINFDGKYIESDEGPA